MTTVALEGNKRAGKISIEEIEQSILDISAWFKKRISDVDGVSNADFERFEKVLGNPLPIALKLLLKECDGQVSSISLYTFISYYTV